MQNLDNEPKPFGWTTIGLALVGMLVVVGMCSSNHGNSSQDQRAYDELKRRGFSDTDASNAASAVRRLCEAGGGTDC